MSHVLLGYLFLLLHVVAATSWFGLAMRIGHHARLVSSIERTAANELATQTQRSVILAGATILAALALALGALVLEPVIQRHAPAFWSALAMLAALVILHYALIGPVWRRMHRAVSIGEPSQVAVLLKGRRRLLALLGVGRILWLLVLVLIAWNAVVER